MFGMYARFVVDLAFAAGLSVGIERLGGALGRIRRGWDSDRVRVLGGGVRRTTALGRIALELREHDANRRLDTARVHRCDSRGVFEG